jgi:hypothetical protein
MSKHSVGAKRHIGGAADKAAGRQTISDGDLSTASDGLSGNRVFVSVAKTINLGNYESIRVEFGCGSTVKDGQDFNEAVDGVQRYVWTGLLQMVKTIESHIKS